MRRGEIWTLAGGGDYMSKPRPAVIVQSDDYQQTESVILCPLTTTAVEAPFARLPIEPSEGNGLDHRSWLMVDKVTSLKRSRLRQRIGVLEREYLVDFNSSVLVLLGIA